MTIAPVSSVTPLFVNQLNANFAALDAAEVPDLATFKATQYAPAVVNVGCKATVGDGWGGSFAYDPDDTTTPGDDALTVVDNLGRRWKRVLGEMIRPEIFGAIGDGVSPEADTAGFTAALAACQTHKRRFDPSGFGKTWLLKDVVINGHDIDFGGAKVVPAVGALWSIRMDGYKPWIRNAVLDDEFQRVIRSTTLSVTVNATDTSVTLVNGTDIQAGMAIMWISDDGRPFMSAVASKASTHVVNLTTAATATATSGRKVDATFGQIYNRSGYQGGVEDCNIVNGSAVLWQCPRDANDPPSQMRVTGNQFWGFSHFGHGDAKHACENQYALNMVRGGVTEITNHTGDGSDTTFSFPFPNFLKRDISVTVNGVALVYGSGAGKFQVTSNTADGGIVTFGTAPANGAAIVITHYRQALFGRWRDGTGFSYIRGGTLYENSAYIHCMVGGLINNVDLTEHVNVKDDTCGAIGTWVRNCNGNALWFSDHYAGYSQVPIKLENSPSVSFAGISKTWIVPAGEASTLSPSAHAILVDAASNGMGFDTFNWLYDRIVDNLAYFAQRNVLMGTVKMGSATSGEAQLLAYYYGGTMNIEAVDPANPSTKKMTVLYPGGGALAVGAGTQIYLNLPTSAGLSGTLWNDSGTVKVA